MLLSVVKGTTFSSSLSICLGAVRRMARFLHNVLAAVSLEGKTAAPVAAGAVRTARRSVRRRESGSCNIGEIDPPKQIAILPSGAAVVEGGLLREQIQRQSLLNLGKTLAESLEKLQN